MSLSYFQSAVYHKSIRGNIYMAENQLVDRSRINGVKTGLPTIVVIVHGISKKRNLQLPEIRISCLTRKDQLHKGLLIAY